jgi:hypothetical protein
MFGKTVGPIRMESRLDAGGMGIVYRARDEQPSHGAPETPRPGHASRIP